MGVHDTDRSTSKDCHIWLNVPILPSLENQRHNAGDRSLFGIAETRLVQAQYLCRLVAYMAADADVVYFCSSIDEATDKVLHEVLREV